MMKKEQDDNSVEFERQRTIIEAKKLLLQEKKSDIEEKSKFKQSYIDKNNNTSSELEQNLELEKKLKQEIQDLKSRIMKSPDKLNGQAIFAEENQLQAKKGSFLEL